MNYYSNPDVIFPRTGTPTGVGGVSNNARVLKVMIGQMAALGEVRHLQLQLHVAHVSVRRNVGIRRAGRRGGASKSA